MQRRKEEARPALESRRATAMKREASIAQRREDRLWTAIGILVLNAAWAYIWLSEAGVIPW